MSFYGNIANGNKSQFIFDRIYPNRATMEEALVKPNKNGGTLGDGVFVGRYVLIEYDDNTFSRRQGYMINPPSGTDQQYVVFSDVDCTTPMVLTENDAPEGYGLAAGDIVYVKAGTEYAYFLKCSGQSNETGYALFDFVIMSEYNEKLQNSDYLLNFHIDRDWALTRGVKMTVGWDSTVWQKVIKEGKESYIMIATLNSDTPTFTVTPEAPSMNPIPPHFAVNSTNTLYALHMQPNWGFRIKKVEADENGNIISDSKVSYTLTEYNKETGLDEEKIEEYDGAIYYNKAGFNKEISTHSDLTNNFTLLPTGISGKLYTTHNDADPLNTSYVEKPDIQELTLYLPEFGNAVADLWDLVYGNSELNGGPDRNLDIEWNSTDGLRLIQTSPTSNIFEYTPKNAETLAGCINSIHDLMGMIISTAPESGQSIEDALMNAQAGRIYYGPLSAEDPEHVGYFYKDTAFKYKSFAEMQEEDPTFNPEEYIGSRKYYDLVQYKPKVYHIFSDNNFYWETASEPTEDTVYYLLGEPIKVLLKPWQSTTEEVDEETGEKIEVILYSYYKDEGNNYIQDTSSTPDPEKEYFTLKVTQVTIPEPEKDQILTEIWNPANSYSTNLEVDYDVINKTVATELNISSFGQGYFYLATENITNEDGEIIGVRNQALIGLTDKDEYDENKKYFYIPQFAVAVGQDASQTNQIFYFIEKDGSVVSFTGAITGIDDFNYGQYEISFVPFAAGTYYREYTKEENKKGYKCILLNSDIQSGKIYYTIEAISETGETIIDEETGEIIYVHYYLPGLYYYISGEKDYVLATAPKLNETYQYCFITNKNNEKVLRDSETNLPIISPEEITFYESGKYYYRSNYYQSDILDNSKTMKTPDDKEFDDLTNEEIYVVDQSYIDWIDEEKRIGRVYYTPQESYVIDDYRGILVKGAVWDKNVAPPDTVILGNREEIYVWSELQGFSRTLNTIHGMLLQLNRYFKFNDEYTRDTTTVQGCINSLKDVLNMIDILNPGEMIIVDEYGRMTGTEFKNTDWIETTISPQLNNGYIQIDHKDPNGESITFGQTEKKTLKFGDEFSTLAFNIDAKGHVFTDSKVESGLTLPSLSVVDDSENNTNLTSKILTSLEVDQTGKFTIIKDDIGNLLLTGYQLGSDAGDITDLDNINLAFSKLQAQLKVLNGDSTQEGSVAYQIALIVNENNNGNIDTLNEIAAWIISDDTGAASLFNRVTALENSIGQTTISEQINSAINAALILEDGTTKYALVSDLNGVIKEDTKFNYTNNDSTTSMTLSDLLAYISTLENRIKTLEEANTTT